MERKAVYWIAGIFVLLVIIIVLLVFRSAQESELVDSFEKCATAGYPVMQSYPRRCSDGKNTWTEKIDEEGDLTSDECIRQGGEVVNIVEAKLPYCGDGMNIGNVKGLMYNCVCCAGMSENQNCEDQCGNGICEEFVCLAIGCPCAETKESCSVDCEIPEEILEAAINSECFEKGEKFSGDYSFNNYTKTWWIDLEMKPESENPICSPACVVNNNTLEALINWRCTGLIVP